MPCLLLAPSLLLLVASLPLACGAGCGSALGVGAPAPLCVRLLCGCPRSPPRAFAVCLCLQPVPCSVAALASVGWGSRGCGPCVLPGLHWLGQGVTCRAAKCWCDPWNSLAEHAAAGLGALGTTEPQRSLGRWEKAPQEMFWCLKVGPGRVCLYPCASCSHLQDWL